MGTILVGWAEELEDAEEAGNLLYLLDNVPKVLRLWYATCAVYTFSVVFWNAISANDSGS